MKETNTLINIQLDGGSSIMKSTFNIQIKKPGKGLGKRAWEEDEDKENTKKGRINM